MNVFAVCVSLWKMYMMRNMLSICMFVVVVVKNQISCRVFLYQLPYTYTPPIKTIVTWTVIISKQAQTKKIFFFHLILFHACMRVVPFFIPILLYYILYFDLYSIHISHLQHNFHNKRKKNRRTTEHTHTQKVENLCVNKTVSNCDED